MRLWHKDLLGVLPRQQLLGQWRECCCIAKNIVENGTPNHILVNKIMDYPIEHFYLYATYVRDVMEQRGYKYDWNKFIKWINITDPERKHISSTKVFEGWHNERYLKQCYYNLQEKYDCGGISEEEWRKIKEVCFVDISAFRFVIDILNAKGD